ncbi:MAG: C40 family peptidase [Lachnospiraceae bacterium]|nr:C40 family peptidase [Lachnospiraceae bacterium]
MTVDKVYAFAAEDLEILDGRSDDAAAVGKIARGGLLYVLEEEDDGYTFVESGAVRGFVDSDLLITGEDAEKLEAISRRRAERIAKILPEGMQKGDLFVLAEEILPYYENDAYAFRRITTQETVIDKVPVLAKEGVSILEEPDTDAGEVGTLEEGGLAFVIEDAGAWYYIESGDVRGFVQKALLETGGAQAAVDERGEENLATADKTVDTIDKKALYYSLHSVKEGTPYNEIREKIVEKAATYIGNPYVWGGTSLTNGADCSGFVQSLFKLFGYSLPRVAAAQSQVGTQIPVSDAAPGDLIFFAKNGYVYHVALYAGDGKTIEAYSTGVGIIMKEISDRSAVWATRIIED